MSWRNGSRLFAEVWPAIKRNISDEKIREEFTKELLELFMRWDMDPHDVSDIDFEISQILGCEVSDDDDLETVRLCILGLKEEDPEKRKSNAEAICHFVGFAGGEMVQEAAQALKDAIENEQSDEFTVVALSSLRELVWEYNAVVDKDVFVKLLSSSNSEIKERSQYVINGLER